jgi:hypothetical protein
MKLVYSILFLSLAFGVNAQSKKTVQVLAKSSLLIQTVFSTKDSATLEKLFAKELLYEHSSGKIENRQEAIKGIIYNKSVYEDEAAPYNVVFEGDSAVVNHIFKAKEKKADGSIGALNINIRMVWKKEGGDWKLIRRKATKNQ